MTKAKSTHTPANTLQIGQVVRLGIGDCLVTASAPYGSAWMIDTDKANGYGGTSVIVNDPNELVEVIA